MIDYAKSEIKKSGENGLVLAAICTLENGFEFYYSTTNKGGILTVFDGRHTECEPVGMICNFTASNIEEIEKIVGKVIWLYEGHQIISIARSIEDFIGTFNNVA